MIGRIDFMNKTNDTIINTQNYDSWEKMKAQIKLEDDFESPFVAVIYDYHRMNNFVPHSKTSEIKYIQEMIPDDAEKDRFWIGETSITAVYFNPNGGENELGDFLQHNFDFEYILQCDKEAENDKAFLDMLYGDARRCPTYCIDVGTTAFEDQINDWHDGIRPTDTSPKGIRKWMVETVKSKKEEYELKFEPTLYLKLLPGENHMDAMERAENLLIDAGFDILDAKNLPFEIRKI